MYLYFTADNSEEETECKVTRSGKYEKVITCKKKKKPQKLINIKIVCILFTNCSLILMY